MTQKDRLDKLEKKVDLIMDKLGLEMESPKPVLQVLPGNEKEVQLELQKVLNEIKVLKIKFRKVLPSSPMKQHTLDQIDALNLKKDKLQAELNAVSR